MISLLEFATFFRIAAFILYILMTYEKKLLFFRNDFIYFIGIILTGGLGFFPQIIRILSYVNWMGIQGVIGVFLGIVFLVIVIYGFIKRKNKFDGYNQLATMILFLLMAQWFLLTSSANT